MAKNPIPTPEELRQLLDYSPNTGNLTWRLRDRSLFASDWAAKKWNTRHAGKVAGGPDHQGYILLAIWNRKYKAHRVAWAIYYGEWPSGEIDHINHKTGDNRISNLRDVSHDANHRNIHKRADNRSGVTGVYRRSGRNGWHVSITHNQKRIYLGSFDTIEQAAKARREAEAQFSYHENHGS